MLIAMSPLVLATLAALIGLPALGMFAGFVQLAWYRLRRTPADDIPFFGFLVLRGMIVGLGVLVGLAILTNALSGPAVPALSK